MVPEILDILFYKQSHTLKTKLLQGLNTWRSIKTKQKKLLNIKDRIISYMLHELS